MRKYEKTFAKRALAEAFIDGLTYLGYEDVQVDEPIFVDKTNGGVEWIVRFVDLVEDDENDDDIIVVDNAVENKADKISWDDVVEASKKNEANGNVQTYIPGDSPVNPITIYCPTCNGIAVNVSPPDFAYCYTCKSFRYKYINDRWFLWEHLGKEVVGRYVGWPEYWDMTNKVPMKNMAQRVLEKSWITPRPKEKTLSSLPAPRPITKNEVPKIAELHVGHVHLKMLVKENGKSSTIES